MDTKHYCKSIIAYVDGSYEPRVEVYGYACVMIDSFGKEVKISGSGNKDGIKNLRNVAGEMIAAMCAVQWAIQNGYKSIDIRYDYAGIAYWVDGTWKAKNKYTSMYSEYMKSKSKEIDIKFKKVKAHSGDFYNIEADKLAREAVKNHRKYIKGDFNAKEANRGEHVLCQNHSNI